MLWTWAGRLGFPTLWHYPAVAKSSDKQFPPGHWNSVKQVSTSTCCTRIKPTLPLAAPVFKHLPASLNSNLGKKNQLWLAAPLAVHLLHSAPSHKQRERAVQSNPKQPAGPAGNGKCGKVERAQETWRHRPGALQCKLKACGAQPAWLASKRPAWWGWTWRAFKPPLPL